MDGLLVLDSASLAKRASLVLDRADAALLAKRASLQLLVLDRADALLCPSLQLEGPE